MASESLIYIPTYRDLVLPDASSVREEVADCNEYCDEVVARMLAVGLSSLHSGHVVTFDDTAIAGYGSAPGMTTGGNLGNADGGRWVSRPQWNNGAGGACQPQQRDGGTPQPECNPLWTQCGRVPMPVNTIGKSGYPLAGTALGTLTVGSELTFTAQRAQTYYPKSVFFRGLDQQNGLATIEAFLINPRINGNPQLVGSGDTINNAITSAVNSLGFGPFAVDSWRPITNTEPEVLLLKFGHIYAASSSLQVVGLFFGDAANNPANAV